ncbi:MAG: alpha/beta hydrolase family protein [Desulfovibrionaceae bacterium]
MTDVIRRKMTVPLMVVGILGMVLLNTAYAEDEAAFDAHGGSNFIFEDGDMDFHFINLILGSTINGGVEIGEAFYVASQIKDGDSASWQKEWFEMAERVEKRGLKSLAEGHTVSARDQLLRAANYYRISLLGMTASNPEFKKRGMKCRELMKKAGPLFDPPLEYFEIPFEGAVLPGFFRKANNSPKPNKTLIMIGGGETFIEDLFFYIAPQAYARGYNFMAVDLPGQGMLPAEGKVFRTDNEVPMKAVVDYALSRKDVDPKRLAAYGISGGGIFVPQAAEHDKRLKAIVVSSATVDGYALFAAMPAAASTEKERAGWSSFHGDIVKSICERYGVSADDPAGLIEANKGNTFDPTKITVPVLILVGEGEYSSGEVQRQQKIVMDGLPNPAKEMIITPADEGATNHCLMENRSLVGLVVFDWLDDILK